MTEIKSQTINKQVQTTIHCFPHILLSDNQLAKVFSDRGCQTAASTTPETTDTNFYASLEFTPYQVIAEGCIKEIDLPRKALLQWNLPTATEFEVKSNSSRTAREDSELFTQRSVLKKSKSDLINVSYHVHHHFIMQKSVVDQEVQTTLSVLPHVLDADEVANVFTELSIQTSITCLPNESISNILPQLKANLSHANRYTETPSVFMNQPPEIEPSEDQTEGEEEVERIDDPSTQQPDEPQEESPEESPEEPPEEPPAESDEGSPKETGEQSSEEPPDENMEEQATQVDTLSVTISAAKVESKRVCSCRTKMLNQMVSTLGVQASTLKVTPIAFPPNVPFGERMMEVLNTIIAVLQTEMANLMEIYVEEEKAECACTDRSTEMSLKDIKSDPRSCKCANTEAATNTDNNQTAIANDPRSCNCGAGTMPQNKPSTISQGSQKEVRKTTVTHQIINPNTMQPEFVKEDVVEETIRTVTLSNNNERIVQEKIVTKTVREKLPGASFTGNTAIEPAKGVKPPCRCSSKSGVDVIKPVDECAPIGTETEDLAEPASEATEAPIEEDELSEMAAETVPLPEDDIIDETEPPAVERECVDEIEPPAVEDELVDEAEEEAPEQEAAPEARIEPQSEVVGDGAQNRRLSFIPCECHPTETGAAVPTVMSPGPSAQVVPATESAYDPCSCPENLESTTTDIANASSNIDELSMITDDAPSLVDDAQSAGKTVKLKILLKKGITDVKSVSATSAIVVRATLSSPDTNKAVKPKVSAASSLPDLREQVIRLRVIYKTGPTEPETQIEELLTPGCPVTIAPNKPHSSRVIQTASKISTTVSFKSSGAGGKSESERLVCAKGPSEGCNKPTAAITDPCECAPPRSSRRQPADNKPLSSLPIEIEEIRSSSMACPVHSKKPPSCVPACTPRSTPSSQPPGRNAANSAAVEVIISYTTGAEHNDDVQSPSFMYEHDPTYDEPYMDELVETEDATTGVQTDLTLGDKLQSESLNSLGEAECICVLKECGSKTEMPWQNISLPLPGSYSIQPSVEPTQQVGVMTDTEGEESAVEEEIEEVAEGDVVEEEVVEGGEQEGDGGGDETDGAAEKATDEAEDDEERPKRKEVLLFESEVYKDNEPYMEGLYRAYPDSDEGECGSQTEIPWKDIVLPEHCRIKKVLKQKKCTCKSGQGKISGMFIPSNQRPRNLYDDEEESLVVVHAGIDEYPSTIMRVNEGGAASQHTLSFVSTVSQNPKRVPKNFTLLVDVTNKSISFQTEMGKPQNIPIGSVLGPTSSQPFSVSTAFGGTSSAIINIKPSTERQFISEKIPVPGANERLLQVVNPSTYGGAMPTEAKSCTATSVSKPYNNMSVRNTASMPQVPSQNCVKATVSLKRLGEDDKVVTKTMNLVPGENRMTLQVPDTPMNVNLNMTTPVARAQTPTASTPVARAQTLKASQCPAPCSTPSTPCPPASAEPKEVFSPAKCECKDKVKLDTFRQDPVMAALEAYESEMRPLRQALTQLQQKIRNLNMPEMKGCLCTTVLQSPPPCSCSTTTGSAQASTDPSAIARAANMRTYPRQNPLGTCPHFQPASFRPPVAPPHPYGRLPPPMIPPRFDPYMQASPNYMPPSAGPRRQNCCELGESRHSRTSGHKRHGREHRSNRDYGRSYPREDLAREARYHGMYPDYRGRRYSNEKVAYQDSFVQDSRHKRGGSPDRYKTQHAVCVRSSGNVTSDYGGCDSQGASDGEDSYYLPQSNRKSNKRDGHGRHSNEPRFKPGKQDECTPCRDLFDAPLRDGQAVKTSPDEFLSYPGQSKRKKGQNVPSVISRTKIQIKFPRN